MYASQLLSRRARRRIGRCRVCIRGHILSLRMPLIPTLRSGFGPFGLGYEPEPFAVQHAHAPVGQAESSGRIPAGGNEAEHSAARAAKYRRPRLRSRPNRRRRVWSPSALSPRPLGVDAERLTRRQREVDGFKAREIARFRRAEHIHVVCVAGRNKQARGDVRMVFDAAFAPDHIGGVRSHANGRDQRARGRVVLADRAIGPARNIEALAGGMKQDAIGPAARS